MDVIHDFECAEEMADSLEHQAGRRSHGIPGLVFPFPSHRAGNLLMALPPTGPGDGLAQEYHRQHPDQHDRQRRQGGVRQALVGSHLERAYRQRVEIERPHDQGRRKFLHHVDEDQEGRGQNTAAHDRDVHPPQSGERSVAKSARRSSMPAVILLRLASTVFNEMARNRTR